MTCHLGGIWCSVAFFIPFSEKRNVDVFTPSGVVSPVGSSDQNDGTRTDYRINFAERFCARLAGYVLMTASVVRVTCTLLISSIIEKNYFVTRRKLGLKNVAFPARVTAQLRLTRLYDVQLVIRLPSGQRQLDSIAWRAVCGVCEPIRKTRILLLFVLCELLRTSTAEFTVPGQIEYGIYQLSNRLSPIIQQWPQTTY